MMFGKCDGCRQCKEIPCNKTRDGFAAICHHKLTLEPLLQYVTIGAPSVLNRGKTNAHGPDSVMAVLSAVC